MFGDHMDLYIHSMTWFPDDLVDLAGSSHRAAVSWLTPVGSL